MPATTRSIRRTKGKTSRVKDGASAPLKQIPSRSINPQSVSTWPGPSPVKADPSLGPVESPTAAPKAKRKQRYY